MTWLVIQHQLVDLPTTYLHHRACTTFRETQFTHSSTPPLSLVAAHSSLESGSMSPVQVPRMLSDSSSTKSSSLRDKERSPWSNTSIDISLLPQLAKRLSVDAALVPSPSSLTSCVQCSYWFRNWYSPR